MVRLRTVSGAPLAPDANDDDIGGMADPITRDEMAARLELAEARTETRFAALETRLAAIDGKFALFDARVARVSERIDGQFERASEQIAALTAGITSLAEQAQENRRFTVNLAVTLWITLLIAVAGTGIAVWQGVIGTQSALIGAFQTGLSVHPEPGGTPGAASSAPAPQPASAPASPAPK